MWWVPHNQVKSYYDTDRYMIYNTSQDSHGTPQTRQLCTFLARWTFGCRGWSLHAHAQSAKRTLTESGIRKGPNERTVRLVL